MFSGERVNSQNSQIMSISEFSEFARSLLVLGAFRKFGNYHNFLNPWICSGQRANEQTHGISQRFRFSNKVVVAGLKL